MKIRTIFGEFLFAISALCGAGLVICMIIPLVLLFMNILNVGYFDSWELTVVPIMGLMSYGIPNLACGFFSLSLLEARGSRRRNLVIKVPWFIVGGIFGFAIVGAVIRSSFYWLLK